MSTSSYDKVHTVYHGHSRFSRPTAPFHCKHPPRGTPSVAFPFRKTCSTTKTPGPSPRVWAQPRKLQWYWSPPLKSVNLYLDSVQGQLLCAVDGPNLGPEMTDPCWVVACRATHGSGGSQNQPIDDVAAERRSRGSVLMHLASCVTPQTSTPWFLLPWTQPHAACVWC